VSMRTAITISILMIVELFVIIGVVKFLTEHV
jgi:hypothetical protein